MPRGATARLFVAVDPPAEVCEELVGWARDAATAMRGARGAAQPLRLLEVGTLHLTLCFLGSRPIEELEEIASALSACVGHLGELSIGAPLWLPPKRPRALAVEIGDEDGELARLQREVACAISAAIDWEPERRRFRAHITVARMRGAPSRRRSAGEPPIPPATPQLRFTPASVVLYRSWLSPAGASYEAIATCALVPGDL